MKQTWVEINGDVFGAKPDALGPIGGGNGYARILTHGDHGVRTIDELLAALSQAKEGQTVLIDGQADLDFTDRVFLDNNTFLPGYVAVIIRGVPQNGAEIHHNWFSQPRPGRETVITDGNTNIQRNVYGPEAKLDPCPQT